MDTFVGWTEEQRKDTLSWLEDRRGKPFFKWIEEMSAIHHASAGRPIGANPLKDILDSQRNLEAGNAYGMVAGFVTVLREFLQDQEKEK